MALTVNFKSLIKYITSTTPIMLIRKLHILYLLRSDEEKDKIGDNIPE